MPSLKNLAQGTQHLFLSWQVTTTTIGTRCIRSLRYVNILVSATKPDDSFPNYQFLTPYKVLLEPVPGYISPWTNEQPFTITAIDHTENLLPGTRNVTIVVSHPGLIWTVVAFDAHVLKWSLDDNPPDEYTQHRLKEASFYGHDTYSFDLLIKVDEEHGSQIPIKFTGMQEKGIWPAKKAEKALGGPAMQLFENLDAWLEEKTEGKVDALLIGCVAGAAAV